VVLGFVATVSCGGSSLPNGPSQSGAVRVSGRVLDFVSGAGIAGAAVAYGDRTATTDGSGSYAVDLPAAGAYDVRIDGVILGSNRVRRSAYRGDLFAHGGTCVSRYGTLADAATGLPIAGATVTLVGQLSTTGADGWYRVDLGCPASGLVGSNTTFMEIRHPRYADGSQIAGRGVRDVVRLDVDLQPR